MKMKNRSKEATITRLNELAKMKDGWFNGEGRAIKKSTINSARSLLTSLISKHQIQPFFIYPTPEGLIQLECDIGNYIYEVVINGSKVSGDALCLKTDKYIDLIIGEDIGRSVAEWMIGLMLSGKAE